jgi:hypothetical protein
LQVLKELKKDKADKKKVDSQKKKIDDFTTKMKLAEKLAGVALGTSRLNYIDPRITLAWCKEAQFDFKRLFPRTQQVCAAWGVLLQIVVPFTSSSACMLLLAFSSLALCQPKPKFSNFASQAKFQWAIDEIINSDSKAKFEW